jgi:hypothetical protein
MVAQTVKGFVQDSYQLVSASSPTVPLHGNDISKGIQFLNELLQAYSATGLMITIAKHITFTLPIAQQEITFGAPDYIPTPDVTVGRLANLQNAWLLLDGVTYPLIDESRNTFFASYKYDPQVGLPRFIVITNETDLTRMRFYPAASQVYEVNVYGKFQLLPLGENDNMSILPTYYIRYLRFALAKDLALYKGRTEAWNQRLEEMLIKAEQDMMSVSSVNLNIETEQESYLNGSWRVRAGV